jgi:hypothetical protein
MNLALDEFDLNEEFPQLRLLNEEQDLLEKNIKACQRRVKELHHDLLKDEAKSRIVVARMKEERKRKEELEKGGKSSKPWEL